MADNRSLEEIWHQVNQAYQDSDINYGRCNVLVIGKTGVGKSTLINTIFRDRLAATGVGYPITQGIRRYTKPQCPITVYDTPGLELAPLQVNQIKLEVFDLIDEQRLQPAAEHIHVIWYCLNHESHKLDPVEETWLQQLALRDVPIILVLTQTLSRKPTPFQIFLQGKNLTVDQMVAVLAEPKELDDDYRIKSHGLDQLVAITAGFLPESAKKAFLREQTRNLDLKAQAAFKYVSGYVAGSAVVGASPIPFADAPILITMQTVMIGNITRIFGVSLSREFVITIFSALGSAGGLATVGRAIAGNLLKLIPGAGSVVGGAITGGTAAALTLALGLAYIRGLRIYLQRQLDGAEMDLKELAAIIVAQYRYFATTGKKDLENLEDLPADRRSPPSEA